MDAYRSQVLPETFGVVCRASGGRPQDLRIEFKGCTRSPLDYSYSRHSRGKVRNKVGRRYLGIFQLEEVRFSTCDS